MNYKPHFQQINFAGVITPIPIGGRPVSLSEEVKGSSVADAMVEGIAVYSVTSGKKFRALGMEIFTSNATTICDIAVFQADTEDATTVLKVTVQSLTSVYRGPVQVSFDVEFASGKFITIVPTSTIVDFIRIVGYEF